MAHWRSHAGTRQGGNVTRPRGFTLLEVMLAFVILAVAMGLLLGMLSRGLGQVRTSQDESEVALHAQSLLDQVGVIEPVQTGGQVGEFANGRYRYRLETTEVEDPSPAPALPPVLEDPGSAINAPKIYRVALVVSWGPPESPRQMRFTTLRARSAALAGERQ